MNSSIYKESGCGLHLDSLIILCWLHVPCRNKSGLVGKNHHLKPIFLVWDNPKLLDDGGEIPKSQGRGWWVDPRLWNLLSTCLKNLPGCQLPRVLWRWLDGLLSQKNEDQTWPWISDRGDFWAYIIGWHPSVCKSNRLHVDILRFPIIKLGYKILENDR